MAGKGQDVVLRIKGNLSFIGHYMDDLPYQGQKGLFIQLDKESGVMIWCPEEMVDQLIPLTEEGRSMRGPF